MNFIFNFLYLLFFNPKRFLIRVLTRHRFFQSDQTQVKIIYFLEMGKKLNLKNPKTFCEKIQWLKLNDRRDEYTIMVDKYAVKEYVAKKIGLEHIIPTLNVWSKVEDIEFNSLPEQFVLKVTHGGGGSGVSICKNKEKYNKKKEFTRLKKWLMVDGYSGRCEWPYKNVNRCIICEKYMTDNSNNDDDLIDYKFYCFNGKPEYCQVIRNRRTKETIEFYDMQWNIMPFWGLNPMAKPALTPITKPINFNKMIEICKILSKDIPFVRIDLYEINFKVYFGEITFYPASGVGRFTPNEWNYKLGDLIKLPIVDNKYKY